MTERKIIFVIVSIFFILANYLQHPDIVFRGREVPGYLITGKRGFVGLHQTGALIERDDEIITLKDPGSGELKNAPKSTKIK